MRVYIAPVFHRSDIMPGMWSRQRGTCLMKCRTFPRPGQFFSNDIFPWLPRSIPSCWSIRQIPGLDRCKEIIHMFPSLFSTLFKKRNKTLQYNQHDSMLFLDFKILRLDVLMIYSGATFIRRARACLASTSEEGMDGSVLLAWPSSPQCHACSSRTGERYRWS